MIDPRQVWTARPPTSLGIIRHIRIPRPWWVRVIDLFRRT